MGSGFAETQVLFNSIVNVSKTSFSEVQFPEYRELGNEIELRPTSGGARLDSLYFQYASSEAQIATVRIRQTSLNGSPRDVLPLLFERRIILLATSETGGSIAIPLGGLWVEGNVVWTLSFEKPERVSIGLADSSSQGSVEPGFWINPASRGDQNYAAAWQHWVPGTTHSSLHLQALIIGGREPSLDGPDFGFGAIELDQTLSELVIVAQLGSLSTLTPGFEGDVQSVAEVVRRVTLDAQSSPQLSTRDVLRQVTLPNIGFGAEAIERMLALLAPAESESEDESPVPITPTESTEAQNRDQVGNVVTVSDRIGSSSETRVELPKGIVVGSMEFDFETIPEDFSQQEIIGEYDIILRFLNNTSQFSRTIFFETYVNGGGGQFDGITDDPEASDELLANHGASDPPPMQEFAFLDIGDAFNVSQANIGVAVQTEEAESNVPIQWSVVSPIEQSLFQSNSEWQFTQQQWLTLSATNSGSITIRVEGGEAQVAAYQIREAGSNSNGGKVQLVDLSGTKFVQEHFEAKRGLRFSAFPNVRYAFNVEASGSVPTLVSIVQSGPCSTDGLEPCPEEAMEQVEAITRIVIGNLPTYPPPPRFNLEQGTPHEVVWDWPFNLWGASEPDGPWERIAEESPYPLDTQKEGVGFFRLEFAPLGKEP